MDYEYFSGELDLQWNDILHKYLSKFSCQNKEKTLSFDDVLKYLFLTDQEADYETKYGDKELCEKCVVEALTFTSIRPVPSKQQSRLCFILNMVGHIVLDETCFINLNVNGVLQNVIYLTQCMQQDADRSLKLLFGKLIRSSLEHETGLKWTMELQYWMHQYHMVVQFPEDKDITELGYNNLTKIFQKSVDIDLKIYEQTFQTIAKPLIEASTLFNNANGSPIPSTEAIKPALLPSATCLIEILERLLKYNSANILNQILTSKIEAICDDLAQKLNDKELVLILRRITIILSFFALTQVFDGIKSINQDPLKLSGFLKICDSEVDKGNLSVVLELFHYAVIYTKYIGKNLPKYTLKGKALNIEAELVALQIEPIILIADKTKNFVFSPDRVESIRMSFLAQILTSCSVETLHVGYKIRSILPSYQTNLPTVALNFIVKTKEYYSPENLGPIFECLIYSFEDILRDINVRRCLDINHGKKVYICTLFSTIANYIEDFDSSWGDRVKAMDVPQIMFDFLMSYNWPTEIIVKGLVLMKVAIMKRLSPCMSLLIDTPDSIKDIGPLLYRKCFNSEWEIRNAVLDVIHTIAYNANKTFASFKEILVEASLVSLVSTMALNDENASVRATAFKCLREIIEMEGVDHCLTTTNYLNKVLNTITNAENPTVQSEAIQFIENVYLHEENLPADMIVNFYKCLERQALYTNQLEVRKASVKFWQTVVRKFFRGQGWIDQKFPSIVFSKRIVTMTKKEIRARIYKILTELSRNGCLNVFRNLFGSDNVHPEVADILKKFMEKFYDVFREYEITEESMTIANGVSLKPSSTAQSSRYSLDSCQIMQELLNDTEMTMMPGDLNFCPDEELLLMLDGHTSTAARPATECVHKTDNISPAEFVSFVFRKVSTVSGQEECLQPQNNDVYVIDY